MGFLIIHVKRDHRLILFSGLVLELFSVSRLSWVSLLVPDRPPCVRDPLLLYIYIFKRLLDTNPTPKTQTPSETSSSGARSNSDWASSAAARPRSANSSRASYATHPGRARRRRSHTSTRRTPSRPSTSRTSSTRCPTSRPRRRAPKR